LMIFKFASLPWPSSLSERAVGRRGLLVGANPTWQLSLQPVAVGAIEKGYTIGTSPLMQKGQLG
jgi:hypothetical protein